MMLRIVTWGCMCEVPHSWIHAFYTLFFSGRGSTCCHLEALTAGMPPIRQDSLLKWKQKNDARFEPATMRKCCTHVIICNNVISAFCRKGFCTQNASPQEACQQCETCPPSKRRRVWLSPCLGPANNNDVPTASKEP